MSSTELQYGEQIRERRIELGLTQRQVAERCGITDSALAHIERELRLPSETVAEQIARALQLKTALRAEVEAALKRARTRRAQARVRSRAAAQEFRGDDAPNAEEVARDLAADPFMLEGYRYLKAALGRRGQRKVVLRALKAWASEN